MEVPGLLKRTNEAAFLKMKKKQAERCLVVTLVCCFECPLEIGMDLRDFEANCLKLVNMEDPHQAGFVLWTYRRMICLMSSGPVSS